MKDAIAHFGLTAVDLGFGKAPRQAGKSVSAATSKPAKGKRKGAAAKTPKKAVKFREEQGNIWGGISKRPDWFKAAMAAGKTPESLLAKS